MNMPAGFQSPFGQVNGFALNPALSQTPQAAQLKAAQQQAQNRNQPAIPLAQPEGNGTLSDLSALVTPQLFTRNATAIPNRAFAQSALPAGANTLQAPVILPQQLQQPQLLQAPQLPEQRIPYIYA